MDVQTERFICDYKKHICIHLKRIKAEVKRDINRSADEDENEDVTETRFTLAPCFCSTSIMSLWARSAATWRGVMKLQGGETKRRRW